MQNFAEDQIIRQDFVDNQIYDLVRRLNPSAREMEWNIEMIGDIRETIQHWLVDKYKIVDELGGPRARPMKPEWVYDIKTQCKKYCVPFFFKQWGTFDASGKRVGKKVAGRVLDGKTWDEIPVVVSQ